jgi:TonB family protein
MRRGNPIAHRGRVRIRILVGKILSKLPPPVLAACVSLSGACATAPQIPVAVPAPDRTCGVLDSSNEIHAAYLHQVQERIDGQWVYPAKAAREGRSGRVEIDFAWHRDGKVLRVHVRRSSGHEELDRYAVNAIRLAVLPPVPEVVVGDCVGYTATFTYTLTGSME